MDKQEFLGTLRDALQDEISLYEIEEQLRYYSAYISDDAEGKTEEEKLKELGDPRLIARTIIDAAGIKKDSSYHSYYENRKDEDGNSKEAYQDYTNGELREKYSNVWSYSWNSLKWHQKLIAIVLVVLVLTLIVSLVAVGINLFFSVVLPIIVVVILVKLLINLFKK